MNLDLENGLAFVSVTLSHQDEITTLNRVLLDTGSAATIFKINEVEAIGLIAEPKDSVERIRGVGGVEFVLRKRIDRITLETLQVENFEIQLGALEYGLDINGILGLDFLLATGSVIDFRHKTIQ
jgi:hypothetical protein